MLLSNEWTAVAPGANQSSCSISSLFLLVVLNSIVGNVSCEPYGLRFLEMFEYIPSLKLPQLLPLPQYQEFCDTPPIVNYCRYCC